MDCGFNEPATCKDGYVPVNGGILPGCNYKCLPPGCGHAPPPPPSVNFDCSRGCDRVAIRNAWLSYR
eukprot:UC4_evm1s996